MLFTVHVHVAKGMPLRRDKHVYMSVVPFKDDLQKIFIAEKRKNNSNVRHLKCLFLHFKAAMHARCCVLTWRQSVRPQGSVLFQWFLIYL